MLEKSCSRFGQIGVVLNQQQSERRLCHLFSNQAVLGNS
jgi:hypothetical protein